MGCIFGDIFYYTVIPAAILCIFKYIILLCWDGDALLFLADKFGKKIDSLKGKVVWITGASSGIGEGIAVALAKNDVKLVLSARRHDELARVKKRCLGCSKTLVEDDILIIPLDILQLDQHEPAFRKVMEYFGKLDILVNNAGRSQRAIWEDIDLSVDKDMFELNVFSVVNLSRIVVKYFMERGEGHLAVTSSIAGKTGLPFSASYTASKHAINGYYDSLRTEKAGRGIHVTILCPGPVYTPFLEHAFTEEKDKKFGQSTNTEDRRMSLERCGYLSAVALANHLSESWMALTPVLLVMQLSLSYPVMYNFVTRYFKGSLLQKLREKGNTVLDKQEKKD